MSLKLPEHSYGCLDKFSVIFPDVLVLAWVPVFPLVLVVWVGLMGKANIGFQLYVPFHIEHRNPYHNLNRPIILYTIGDFFIFFQFWWGISLATVSSLLKIQISTTMRTAIYEISCFIPIMTTSTGTFGSGPYNLSIIIDIVCSNILCRGRGNYWYKNSQ